MNYLIKNYATILFIILIALSQYKCNTNRQQSPTPEKLTLQKMTPIKVPEPSGLALSYDEQYLWCVSDDISKVYVALKRSKKIMMIVMENIVFSIAIKVIVMALGFFGYASMWLAIFADVGVAI